VDLLLREDKEVVVLDNLSSGKMENLDLRHPNLEFIEGDVLEYPLLVDLLSGCDAVLHLAAIVSVPQSIENPIFTFQVNTQGCLHILQAVYKAKHPVRLVYASSASVYGDIGDLPSRDDVPLSRAALSPYALQKIHAEDHADLYARLFGVKSLGLRYFNVYGPHQDPTSPYSGVISRFLDAYKNNNELTVFGEGEQSRDFIHVADVATANWLALQGPYAGTLNIATGKPQTLLQIIDFIQAAGERPAKKHFGPVRQGDIKASFAATQLAEDLIGFKYSISQEEGIRSMIKS
jgi:nucleoside-diphosphate-sugar epimerase